MGRVTVNETYLSDIADAIRNKLDTEDTYKPSEMAEAIDSISSDGGSSPTINPLSVTANGTYTAPSGVDGYSPVTVNVSTSVNLGTKTITENGTYNASGDSLDGYSGVTVAVSGGGPTADEIADLSYPTGNMVLTGTKISGYGFYGRKNITSITGENVTVLDNYGCTGCTGLTSVYLPKVASTALMSVFQNCSNLIKIGAGDLKVAPTLGQAMFSGCSRLTIIVMPKVRVVNYQATHNCSALTAIDIGKTAATGGTGIAATAFGTANALNVLILRRSQLVPLVNVNAFANTPFKSSGTGGTLYVPSDLKAAYEADTNWATIIGYENNTIAAIEDSIYETQYADGTAIS